jgi:stage II sporulation protein AA (anti-sigma F factor antagonist)
MTDDVTEQPDASRAEHVIDLGQLTVRSDREGEIHTIRLAGEVDLATADPVQRELERAEQSDAASIVLDLSQVTFMDSTGVRLLVTAHARSRADANRLTMLRGGPQVQRVIQLSGVDKLLPFAD